MGWGGKSLRKESLVFAFLPLGYHQNTALTTLSGTHRLTDSVYVSRGSPMAPHLLFTASASRREGRGEGGGHADAK